MMSKRAIKLIESVDERVSLRIVSSVSRVRSNETGASPGSNWGSVSGNWGGVNGIVWLTILVQINATVDKIVEELGGFMGEDGHLALGAGGLDLSGGSSGSLDEWISERSAVSVGESTAVVQTGVGVVVGQNSWCGVDGDIRLAVLVQINALRDQVIVK
jgi:hypothetical protein